jgi:hypothetical protein
MGYFIVQEGNFVLMIQRQTLFLIGMLLFLAPFHIGADLYQRQDGQKGRQ